MGNSYLQQPPSELQRALTHLHKAHEFARDVHIDIWEFAEPLPNLVELGVSESVLRWLVLKGYAEHARELTTFREANRRFRPCPNLAFTSKTRFVLTEAGAEFVRGKQEEVSQRASAIPFPTLAAASATTLPHWDANLRVLRVGESIVKQYRQPASNQETVLAAFERAKWANAIDDPLPPVAEICPRMRLRDTIRRLNSSQTTHLLRFHGDGSGTRLSWEMVVPLNASGLRTHKAA